jgi:hypothetical protein
VAGNIDGFSTFIHENICLPVKPVPYRILVRRLSSIFIVKSTTGTKAAAKACDEFLSEIDVIDRVNKVFSE